MWGEGVRGVIFMLMCSTCWGFVSIFWGFFDMLGVLWGVPVLVCGWWCATFGETGPVLRVPNGMSYCVALSV